MCNREISSRLIDWSFPRSSTTIRGRSPGGGGVVPTPLTVRVMRNVLTGRGLRWGLGNFLTFPIQGMLYQIFEFLLCAEAPPGLLSRGHVCQVSDIFFLQIFGNCKNLIVCDGLVYWETCPEIWPKSFKKQRSYDNFKHLVKRTANFTFGPLNPKFSDFWYFRKRIFSSRRGKSNGVYPIEIGLTVLRSQGGPNRPPHQ